MNGDWRKKKQLHCSNSSTPKIKEYRKTNQQQQQDSHKREQREIGTLNNALIYFYSCMHLQRMYSYILHCMCNMCICVSFPYLHIAPLQYWFIYFHVNSSRRWIHEFHVVIAAVNIKLIRIKLCIISSSFSRYVVELWGAEPHRMMFMRWKKIKISEERNHEEKSVYANCLRINILHA